MKKYAVMVLTTIVAALSLVALVPTSALADECTKLAGGTLACGVIRHYSPDSGYDTAINVKCSHDNGPVTYHNVSEGESSKKYCKDADAAYVGPGEEIWCGHIGSDRAIRWTLEWDAQGWHRFNDLWDTGVGCTKRED